MDYAAIVRDVGCQGPRVAEPEQLAPAVRAANEERSWPSVADMVVTRDVGKLPARRRQPHLR